MWNARLDEAQAEIKIPGEISITSYIQMIPLMPESKEELKSLLMKVKEESEKASLKLNIKKRRSWHPIPSLNGRWGNNGNSERVYFLGLQNHCRWWLQPWKLRHLLLGRKAMTNLVSVLKSRDITLPTKVHIDKAMAFPFSNSEKAVAPHSCLENPMDGGAW